jgi:hypothetical protein
MSIEQYIDDTTYLQWEDGMYVMLDRLECDYEKLEQGLRRAQALYIATGETTCTK